MSDSFIKIENNAPIEKQNVVDVGQARELHFHGSTTILIQKNDTTDITTDKKSIVLPSRLLDMLGDNKDTITAWVAHASTFFIENPHYFSEYGGQGVSHVNAILKYVDLLIPDKQALSPESVVFLIMGSVLHDLARQIDRDGFIRLLKNSTWTKRWTEYCAKASRFSDSEQINFFGQLANVASAFPAGTQLPKEETIEQLVVISDFIRNWHSYIAYDIAIGNFAISEEKSLFNVEFKAEHCDLIGRIAQSHTVRMPLRDMELLLKKSKYGGKTSDLPFDTPVFYLMVLLRLADLFDAKASHSPFQRKWIFYEQLSNNSKHLTLKDVVSLIAFPPKAPYDSVWVEAYPKTTKTFVITKEWIEAIQHELDYSWAVLCEKYRSDYELSIHRVYSNITDPDTVTAFQRDFVTDKAYLRADTNILKHLIAPLYGNDASYGVRELVANAVDAVNERSYLWDSKKIHIAEPDRPHNYSSTIIVSVSESKNGGYIFSISDKGIGMTLDTILNYYLKSGVSFRESEVWKKLFVKNKLISFTRTGRFGVGALAAFLIGDTITVTTRHIEDEKGYSFSFQLNSEIINIERVDCNFGTTITIPITNSKYEQAMSLFPTYFENEVLSKSLLKFESNSEEVIQYTGFGCYRYSFPRVNYHYNDRALKVRFSFVPNKTEIKKGKFSDWFVFDGENCFIAWKSTIRAPRKQVRFFYNGFIINEVTNNIEREYGCDFPIPVFSIDNPTGAIICNLARNRITLPADFILELFRYKMSLLFSIDVFKTFFKKPIIDLFGEKYILVFSERGYTLSNRTNKEHKWLTFGSLHMFSFCVYIIIQV